MYVYVEGSYGRNPSELLSSHDNWCHLFVYGMGVVIVEATRESMVSLFAENMVIVWDNFSA